MDTLLEAQGWSPDAFAANARGELAPEQIDGLIERVRVETLVALFFGILWSAAAVGLAVFAVLDEKAAAVPAMGAVVTLFVGGSMLLFVFWQRAAMRTATRRRVGAVLGRVTNASTRGGRRRRRSRTLDVWVDGRALTFLAASSDDALALRDVLRRLRNEGAPVVAYALDGTTIVVAIVRNTGFFIAAPIRAPGSLYAS